MPVSLEPPHSIDLDHHLSSDVRARTPSAMKAMGRLLGDTSIVSLAGGMPHASLFPMNQATFTVPHPSTLGDVAGWASGTGETMELSLYKGRKGGAIDLTKGLQYGLSNGFEELIKPLHDLTELVHKPPYKDHTTVLTLGCTDGVSKTFTLFCEKGDNVLCEEFSFSASLNSGRAKGITFHGVKIDGDGMVPAELDRIMTEWSVEKQGKKPHMIYTIPCGQNPSGTVLSEERYAQIYAICQKHDLIIMEDDPYFWLQFQHYTPNLEERAAGHAKFPVPAPGASPAEDDIEAILKPFNEYAGVKSFLSRDVDGRVARLDTFSKFFAPGCRTGWVTCNSSFAERYLRVGETNTQTPNGLGQSMLASYFDPTVGWGMGGMLRWIWSVRREYERKRDFFCDNLAKFCDTKYARTVPARGGMFQWIEINLENHPRFTRTSPAPPTGPATNTVALVQELFDHCLANRLLILPAAMFAAYVEGTPNGPAGNIHDACQFFRATYAGETSQIEIALEIFGRCLEEWFTTGQLPTTVSQTA